MKILVVGEERFVKSIKNNLAAGNPAHQLTESYSSIDGLVLAGSGEFDLVVLDCRLPKKNGLGFLDKFRNTDIRIPILALMVSSEAEDVVTCLDAGADACLAKPFSPDILRARIDSLLRRYKSSRGADIRYADLRLDPVNHKVWRHGKEIILTATEYNILLYFMRNAGKAISRRDIAENCWEKQFSTYTNIIDVYINYLRKKIDGSSPSKLIHTVRKQGYVFELESALPC